MSEYNFTQDWFSYNEENWKQLVDYIPNKKSFLEIGSFEGRSTIWLVENAMQDGGEIVCVDTWQGGEDHTSEIMEGSLERFKSNIQILKQKHPERTVTAYKGTSYKTLASLINAGSTFDFIYIDGSHTAWDTLSDACMAFGMLNSGGVLVFDDYMWGEGLPIMHRPKPAIDSFTLIYGEQVQTLYNSTQVALKKL